MSNNQTITAMEFQKFQDQLIALKESKYKTEEKCEFLIRHKTQLESKCAQLERELSRANEVKTRFRSAREMEILMNENQILRDRLSAIEGNFKLQNEIIRTECENLLAENERLKTQIETNKSLRSGDYEDCRDFRDSGGKDKEEEGRDKEGEDRDRARYLKHEVTRLQEEKVQLCERNEALQNVLEVARLAETELVARVKWLEGEKTRIEDENMRMEDEKMRMEKEKTRVEDEKTRVEEEKTRLEEEKTRIEEKAAAERAIRETEAREWEERREKERASELQEREEQLARLEEGRREERLRMEENLTKVEEERQRLEERLAFAEEELRVASRKNQMQMRDVRRQLEREVRLGLEAQARLEEAAAASSGSQNSQAVIGERVVCRSPMGNTDDQSSVYSSDVMCGNAVSGGGGGGVGTLTDDELKNLLDRFTSVQNDLCESKRFIESLKSDKDQLIKTINQQQNIILNYIKNRGGNDCETGSGGSTDESERRVNNHHHNNNNHYHHSTSEALILNGLMSSPPAPMSQFSLQSLVSKVKDSLKSIASKDILYSGDSSKPEVCRVTTAEVKQLQRVCEELMMRCLNLETDLQLSLDLNSGLQKRLTSACVCHHSSDPD